MLSGSSRAHAVPNHAPPPITNNRISRAHAGGYFLLIRSLRRAWRDFLAAVAAACAQAGMHADRILEDSQNGKLHHAEHPSTPGRAAPHGHLLARLLRGFQLSQPLSWSYGGDLGILGNILPFLKTMIPKKQQKIIIVARVPSSVKEKVPPDHQFDMILHHAVLNVSAFRSYLKPPLCLQLWGFIGLFACGGPKP